MRNQSIDEETRIRVACAEDAESILKLMIKMEKAFPLYYAPGERPNDPNLVREKIESYSERKNCLYIVATISDEIVGYCFAEGGQVSHFLHSSYVVITVDSDFLGRGIGTTMMRYLETYAAENGIIRLHLVVYCSNFNAIFMYLKLGYQIEGTLSHYAIVDGNPVDAYVMAKFFSSNEPKLTQTNLSGELT